MLPPAQPIAFYGGVKVTFQPSSRPMGQRVHHSQGRGLSFIGAMR